MKSIKLSILLCLLSLTVSAADLTLTNLQYKTRFELITNWSLFTNSYDFHYGFSANTNAVVEDHIGTICAGYPTAYVGIITSNNYVDVYNNKTYIDSLLLNSKCISKITITWQTNIVYKTNYDAIKQL